MQAQIPDPVRDMDLSHIEAFRQANDITIVDLCRAADINPSTYTRWLQWLRSGKGACPNLRTLTQVQEAIRRLEAAAA